MATVISDKHSAPIDQIKPYVKGNMIQKQALNLSKSKMKAHSQLLPIVCNENDTVILGITQYYAALELQYPNIEIVNMKGLNYEQELFFSIWIISFPITCPC